MFHPTATDPMDIVAHRPWPLPHRPWVMGQRWNDLLFAHWPMAVDRLRAVLPSALPLDVFEGMAWLTVSAFELTHLRPHGLPPLPIVSAFPELNVRTYVTVGGKPGVFFFSLDAGSVLAVEGARLFYHLPYFRAAMRIRRSSGDVVQYTSRRTHRGASHAEFESEYRAAGAVVKSEPGSLEHFLTERYCLYAVDDRRQCYRAEIHHVQWPLQPAEADIRVNTMGAAAGLELNGSPRQLSFAKALDVVVWWPERLSM